MLKLKKILAAAATAMALVLVAAPAWGTGNQNPGQCPPGYEKIVDDYEGGLSWTADQNYLNVILVGGPPGPNRNQLFSDVMLGDVLTRTKFDISHICAEGPRSPPTTTLPEEPTTTLPEEPTTTLPKEPTTTLPEEEPTTTPPETPPSTEPAPTVAKWHVFASCDTLGVDFGEGISQILVYAAGFDGTYDMSWVSSEFNEPGTKHASVGTGHYFLLVPVVEEGYTVTRESIEVQIDGCPEETTPSIPPSDIPPTEEPPSPSPEKPEVLPHTGPQLEFMVTLAALLITTGIYLLKKPTPPTTTVLADKDWNL